MFENVVYAYMGENANKSNWSSCAIGTIYIVFGFRVYLDMLRRARQGRGLRGPYDSLSRRHRQTYNNQNELNGGVMIFSIIICVLMFSLITFICMIPILAPVIFHLLSMSTIVDIQRSIIKYSSDIITWSVSNFLSHATYFIKILLSVEVSKTTHCLLILDVVLVVILIKQYRETRQLALLQAKMQQQCRDVELESIQVIKPLYNELARRQRQISKELQMRKTNEEKAHKEANDAIGELRNLEKVYREVSDKVLCIVCQEKDREVVILSCKHLCMCLRCANKTKKSKCPICRQPIKGYITFYL